MRHGINISFFTSQFTNQRTKFFGQFGPHYAPKYYSYMNRANDQGSQDVAGVGRRRLCIALLGLLLPVLTAAAEDTAQNETLAQLTSRLAQESVAAYKASLFSEFSRDYFARFTRDPEVKAAKHEVAIDATWQLNDPRLPSVCATTMRGYFQDFLQSRMQITLSDGKNAGRRFRSRKQIILREAGGGVPEIPES